MISLMLNKAFTMIEVIVVVGIITVLLTLSISSFNFAQKKSRDAKRKGDLKAIQNSFEQYYTANNFQYPIVGTVTLSGNLISNGSIIVAYPKDPTGGFYQCSSCSLASYQICSTLESETPSNYCLSNQQ